MKLRALVLVLVLANLGFFAWTQGVLDGWVGLPSHGDREPERLARQFQPQSVRIVPPAVAGSTGTASNAAATCLEAGPFSVADAAAAEAVLQQALPDGGWSRRSVERPGVWLVYLGRFATAEGLQRKTDELRRLQAPFDDVKSPSELAPGLSLGRFESLAEAETELAQWVQRGLRGARVVALSEPVTTLALRVERAGPALAARVAALGGEVNGKPLGKAFLACAN